MTHKKKKAPNNTQNKNKNQQRNKGGGNRDADSDNSSKHSQIICAHYERAINLNSFRKSINHITTLECSKKNSPRTPKTVVDCSRPPFCGSDLFICTQCGALVCLDEEHINPPQEISTSHAHEHFATPRSDCHALFLQLSGKILFCVPCGQRLSTEGRGVEYFIRLLLLENKFLFSGWKIFFFAKIIVFILSEKRKSTKT